MLMPYTQHIRDPKNVDYQLIQMINEPYTDMKDDMNLHDQENWIEYGREELRRAKFVSGPHFWSDKDGSPFVTVMFEVRVRFPERTPSAGRVIVSN